MSFLAAQEPTKTERKEALLPLDEIKNVLKEDKLDAQRKKRQVELDKIKQKRAKSEVAKSLYPTADDYWGIVTDYWLIKNAQRLQWEFQHPEYGIIEAFTALMNKMGFYHVKLKLLIVNSTDITHFALPSYKDEYVFLLSLPFMRTLDLTKVELSILLLEDFFRVQEGLFLKNLAMQPKGLGENFHGKELPMKQVIEMSTKYSEVVFKKGYTFEQQYKITQKMNSFLKSDPNMWGSYYRLLKKLAELIKVNLLYKDYNSIYPSPEIQLKWLTPKKKNSL